MLCTLTAKAKAGDENAMLQLINQFQPLLHKYSYKLGYEDAYNDLVLFFVELIHKIPEKIIISSKEGIIVTYFATCLKHHYYYLLKHNIFYINEIDISQLSTEQMHYLESLLSSSEQTNENIFGILENCLTKNELRIIILIYYYGYSSAEIARSKKITRQAVNQLKKRALKKIKKYISTN